MAPKAKRLDSFEMLAGCSTGRSAGFAPRKILSTCSSFSVPSSANGGQETRAFNRNKPARAETVAALQ